MQPLARKEKVTIRELPEETLVYDLERHTMHCLNRTSALVWKHCDGRHDAAALAALVGREMRLPADEAGAAARLALEQLSRRHLLQEAVAPPEAEERLTRRTALRKMAVAAAAALPLVMTLKSPSVAWAQSGGVESCIPGQDCPNGEPCIAIRGSHSSFSKGFCASTPTTTTAPKTKKTTTTRPPTCGQGCEIGGTPCPAGCQCTPQGICVTM